MPKESRTETAAKALARSDLTEAGRAAFDEKYWWETFAASERQKYRRQARIVIQALER